MDAQTTPAAVAARAGRRGWAIVVASVASVTTLLALAACSTGPAPASPSTAARSGVASAAADPSTATTPADPVSSSPPAQDGEPLAVIATTPAGRRNVNPTAPVSVSVTGGTLSSVVMRNATGKRVTGELSADATSWHTTEVLGYGKTYTVRARAVNPAGVPTSRTSRFDTLRPPATTAVSLERIGGYGLTDGAVYGVGIVPIVHFDTPVTDKAAAQQALSVTTTPHVDGSWYWSDDEDVHWRPEKFWKPGTKVTVTAQVYGVEVGRGLYGAADESTSFTIGPRHVTKAYDYAPKAVNKVKVYWDGKLMRTMNTSMGEHTGVTVNGQYINFYTMGGTYTVLEHDNPAIMSSESYGLPADSPWGYAPEPIYWSTKISTDGIYLHELDTTVWAQDHGQDVSHGCLNLNHDNAVWFYKHSRIGDPVIIKGAKGAPTISVTQGGDWSVPWSKWLAGSALS